MSTPDSEILSKFMGKLEKKFGDLGSVSCADQIEPTALSNDPLISELVFSMLVWESSIEHAIQAVECIGSGLIDLNELRVCNPEELSAILPSRYPRTLERSQRLIAVLNTVFARENALTLTHLREMAKKDVVEYFSSIDGLPPFVSSRVILLGLGWHAFPIDDWLTKQLAREGITDPTLSIAEQSHRMERLVRASDALRYYTLIEHWATNERAAKISSNTQAAAKKKGLSKAGDSKSSKESL